MYKKIITLLLAGLFVIQADMTLARTAGQAGAVGGAAGGAILGQAIGRDTEGTLLGTAIGGVLGYMIGNEMDKQGQTYNRPIYRTTPPQTVRIPNHQSPGYPEEELCRPAEILATIDGRAERITTVACLIEGEWIIQERGHGGNTVILEQYPVAPGPMHFTRYGKKARFGRGRYGKHRALSHQGTAALYRSPPGRTRIVIY